ncbi:MAG: peptidoglycan-binding domain-containing protein [Gammaproteobacteria bacterium]
MTATAILLAAGLAATATADELTMMVEKELAALGYDTGPVDGEETMETVIAISKFQAENGMEVSGEVTPQLAGILAAKAANPDLETGAASQAAAAPPASDPAALKAAQQACLQEKVAAAQEAQKKKRGLGRLLSAVTRTAAQQGNYDVARTMNDIYSAGATADDLAAAAKDLGITEDEIAACKDPM